MSVVLPLSQKQNQRPLDLAAFNSGPMTEYQANGPQVVLQEKISYSTNLLQEGHRMSASFAPMCKQAVANLFDNPCWGNLLPSDVWWVVSVGVASSLHRRPLENSSCFWHRLSQASMDAGHYGLTQICLSKPWSQICASQSATVKKNSCNWCRMAQGVLPITCLFSQLPPRGNARSPLLYDK